MSLKDNPAYTWLYRPASEASSPASDGVVLPEQVLESESDFYKRAAADGDLVSFLEKERAYASGALSGSLEFSPENKDLVDSRANEMLAFISRAEEYLNNVVELSAWFAQEYGVNPPSEKMESLRNVVSILNDRFMHELTHLHYLHREIEILRIFIPLANAKQRSQRKIPNMRIEAQQAAAETHKQWRAWGDKLVEAQPDLKGNKYAIANELKSLHNIKQSIGTIRKKI